MLSLAMSSTKDYVSVLFVDGETRGDWKRVTTKTNSTLEGLSRDILANKKTTDDPVYLGTGAFGSTVKYFIDAIEQDGDGIHFLRLTHFKNPAIAYEFKQRDGDLSHYSMFHRGKEEPNGDPEPKQPMRRPSAAPKKQVKAKKATKKNVMKKPAAASAVEPSGKVMRRPAAATEAKSPDEVHPDEVDPPDASDVD